MPGDYDGDGKVDIAVNRPRTAEWLVLLANKTTHVRIFGRPGVESKYFKAWLPHPKLLTNK